MCYSRLGGGWLRNVCMDCNRRSSSTLSSIKSQGFLLMSTGGVGGSKICFKETCEFVETVNFELKYNTTIEHLCIHSIHALQMRGTCRRNDTQDNVKVCVLSMRISVVVFLSSSVILFRCLALGATHHAFHEVALECYLGMLYS